MPWSRISRICLLVSVWMMALYAISQSIFQFIKRRHAQAELPPVAPPSAVPVVAATLLLPRVLPATSHTRRPNVWAVISAFLLLAVVAQLVISYHSFIFGFLTPSHIASSPAIAVPTSSHIASLPGIAVPTSSNVGIRTEAFETGIVTPQWQQQTAYDATWQQSLQDIKTQASARWIEFSLLFSQPTSSSTTVHVTQSTPLVNAFADGIRVARGKGFRVFVVPLMGVDEPGGWAGSIQFSNTQQEQAWFDSYWSVFSPYVQAAAQQGADQMAIATECQWLQQHAPASLWNQLISRIRGVFSGTLTYDMNWYPLDQPIPGWYNNQNINMIGVSSYIPLTDVSTRIDPNAIFGLWRDKIKSLLDSLATRIGKPVLISEIGYRNSSNALYHTWEQDSTLPADADEQAAAYDAALANVIPDVHIAGIFFWGWQDVGRFTLKGQKAVSVLHKWYSSTQ